MTRFSRYNIAMLVLLLIVTAVTSIGLTADIFWLDEELALFRAAGGGHGPFSFGTSVERIVAGSWPPLYYAILVASSTFLGWSEFATRLLSLFAGLLAICVTYRFVSEIASKRAGFIAAVLMASSTFHLHYFHEARGYTLYVLLCVTCMWVYWRLLHKARPLDRRDMVTMAALLASVAYFHYIAALICLVIGLYHLAFVPRDARWLALFKSFIYAGLVFLPWLFVGFSMAVGESRLERGMETVTAIRTSLYAFSNGMPLYALAGIAFITLAGWGRAVRFLLFWIAVALVGAALMNAVTDFWFHVRHGLLLFIPVVMLIALAIDRLLQSSRVLALAAVALWVGVGVYQVVDGGLMQSLPSQVPMVSMDRFSTMQRVIHHCVDDGDLVVIHTLFEDESLYDRVLFYYLGETDYRYAGFDRMADLSRFDLPFSLDTPFPSSLDEYGSRLMLLADNADSVWLFLLEDRVAEDKLTTFGHTLQASHPVTVAHETQSGMQMSNYVREATGLCDLPDV